MEAASWATPLLLLPGVGLLLVSTSARYEAVHQEIHKLVGEDGAQAVGCALHVVRRAAILRTAMLSLYGAAALLAAAGLSGVLGALWRESLEFVPWALSGAAVFCVLVAAAALVRESLLSLRIVRVHAQEIAARSQRQKG